MEVVGHSAEHRINEALKGKYTDYVLVRVESKYNDKIGSLHLALDPKIIQDEFTPDDEVPDDVMNAEKHVRTSGMVVAAPDRLNAITLYEKYAGTPKYTPHISHEIIKDAVLKMPPKMAKNYGRNMYYPGNPVESYQKQIAKPEILPGDIVHFEYTSLLSDLAYFDEDSRGEIYIIPYQAIYCYERNGVMHMVNGWVFVESVTIEKFSSHIILINNKPQQNVGKIAHCSPFLDNYCPKQGETCLFLKTLFTVKDWDQVNNSFQVSGYLINDKIYYPMRQWEIVATEKDGKWQTVNDFVTIKPETINDIESGGKVISTINYDPKAPVQNFKAGQIFIPEASNTFRKESKIRKYGVGTCNGQRVAYGKSSYYLFMDELDLLFIHKKDLWGTFVQPEPEQMPSESFRHEEKFPELYLNK